MKQKTLILLLFAGVTCISSSLLVAQNSTLQNKDNKHFQNERPLYKYLPNQYNNKNTTPAMKYENSTITTVQVNVDSAGHNIVGDAANEPNIAIDPLNPNNMVIGWRQFDNVNSDFRQAGFGYTSDGGKPGHFLV